MLKFKPTIIVDEIAQVVQIVSQSLTPAFKQLDDKITGVHFLHGHPIEIAQTLSDKSKTNQYKFQKYPLIALLQDFPEAHNEIGVESESTLHIIICKGTDPNYKSDQRYDKNFRPYLYPIYIEFLHELHKHKKFVTKSAESIQHTKIDRLFWGVSSEHGNVKNIFVDHLDIIEIRDLKIKTQLNYC